MLNKSSIIKEFKTMPKLNIKEWDWESQVTKGRNGVFTKVGFNPETGIYCYRREWLNQNGERNWCYEVVKPVKGNYPSAEQFGSYGMCISKSDRNLDAKVAYYLNNGFSTPYSQSVKE